MLDELRAIAIFAKTIETGSFRGCAKALGLSPSIGTLKESGLMAKKLFSFGRKLVCSPLFLEKQAKIKKPEDLSAWRRIGI